MYWIIGYTNINYDLHEVLALNWGSSKIFICD